MNTKIRYILSLAILLVLPALLIACAPAAASTVTVTANGDTCTHEGPSRISSKVKFTLEVTPEVQESGTDVYYNFLAVALSESQTADDLRAFTSLPTSLATIPDELNYMFYADVIPGRRQTTQQIDFGANAAYDGGPIYIVCGKDLNNIGVVGPFEVTD